MLLSAIFSSPVTAQDWACLTGQQAALIYGNKDYKHIGFF